ncbi:low temperature requirement protein A [Brevibacterium sp. BRM-1]|uniref:low temperature requirement protein A n=1 Tax=Brevibacterium sp. BRM-1 TaxID=2999062 RepID=UPI00227F2908|nr:low temperature requirement protein A [Brevibacterium sp. BRM-1]WAL41692.1 low temperature requirement protein A [Brevibacterium sp. BRM-1]
MNFTWFATSFDTDDWFYRLMTIGQMSGVMVLAAGIAPAFEHNSYTVLIGGYVVMRIFMVAQWLRASRCGGAAGRAALVYAVGIFATQVLWVLWLLLPESPFRTPLFLSLIVVELLVPVLAERVGSTPWHPHHITERYGLFTLIVLGESLLASTNALIEANEEAEAVGNLIPLAAMTLLITAGLWWVYFWPVHHRTITSMLSSTLFGYGHYFVFAAAGALSVGIEIDIDSAIEGGISEATAGLAVAIPVSAFLLFVWMTAFRGSADAIVSTAMVTAAALILLAPLVSAPIFTTVLILAALVAVLVIRRPVPAARAESGAPAHGDGPSPELAGRE